MAGLLAGLKTDVKVEEETDSLGGRQLVDTDAYPCVVSMMYLGESKGGARNVTIIAKTEAGVEIKEVVYFTSGTAKGCKTTYEKGGKHFALPGFNIVSAIVGLAAGIELSDCTTESRIVKVYDGEQQKEVEKEVDCIVEMFDAEITFGIEKQIVDKTKKNESTGAYDATGETREQNEIVKIFRTEDGLTMVEAMAGAEKAEFMDKWIEKNKGNVRNKAKGIVAGGTAGAPGAAAAPAKKLFGKK